MNRDYWHKQTAEAPLYPDLLWSRPENKAAAGKLLIIGGNAHGFAAVGEAYAEAVKRGIGTARVLLPDSLQKTVGKVLAVGEYAPSTPSGSLAKRALAEILGAATWADATLIAGDLGRNSETAILLEQFASKYSERLALTKDAADYFTKTPQQILTRPETLLVLSFAQLQKLAISARFGKAFTFDMDFLQLVDILHEFTMIYPVSLITNHLRNVFISTGGRVSSTKLDEEMEIWRVRVAAAASVWWLQNPARVFEALTSSLVSSK